MRDALDRVDKFRSAEKAEFEPKQKALRVVGKALGVSRQCKRER